MIEPSASAEPVAKAPWVALRVRPRWEHITSLNLRGKGIEIFLPVYSSHRQWTDRLKAVKVPLFPGYLFCRLDLSNRAVQVVTTPGVIGFVSFGGGPEPIDESELNAVRIMLAAGRDIQTCQAFQPGCKVRVKQGALTGVEGVLVEIRKKNRLVVAVTVLNRGVSVEIDRECVESLKASQHTGMGHSLQLGFNH